MHSNLSQRVPRACHLLSGFHSVLLCALIAGCPESHPPDDPPRPGLRPDLSLSDPPSGIPDGFPAPPDAGPIPETCIEGTADRCLCPDGAEGAAYCRAGSWGECECPTEPPDGDPSAGCREEDPEWCDRRDNDCDGEVDEGHVCPDLSVSNTLPVTGSVWSYRAGEGIVSVLEPFWPATDDEPLGGFDLRPNPVIPGPDGRVFYGSNWDGTFELNPDGPDRAVSTRHCVHYIRPKFSGSGEAIYACSGVVRREGGTVIAEIPWSVSVVAVTESGRALLRVNGEPDWYLLGVDGTIDSVPLGHWEGELRSHSGATVSGEQIFFAVWRERESEDDEAIVFRLNADTGTASIVRRVPNTRYGIALPDGRFFARLARTEPSAPILEFPPDGPPRVASTVEGLELVYRP